MEPSNSSQQHVDLRLSLLAISANVQSPTSCAAPVPSRTLLQSLLCSVLLIPNSQIPNQPKHSLRLHSMILSSLCSNLVQVRLLSQNPSLAASSSSCACC